MSAVARIVYGLGAVFEFTGLLLAAAGFRVTWRDFSTGDERFLEPVLRGLEDAKRAAVAVVARLRRRRHVHAQAISAGAVTITATPGTVSIAAIAPSLTDATDVETLAAAVDQRVKAIYARLDTIQDLATGEVREREKADADLAATLAAEVTRIEGMSRTIAIGGLRLQAAGWLLVAIGFILQTVGNLMP